MPSLYTQSANNLVVLHAEYARLEVGDAVTWQTITDDTGDVGHSVKPVGQSWDKSQAASLHIDMDIHTAGDYELWIRGDTGGQAGAFWLSKGKVKAWWVNMDGFRWWRNTGAENVTLETGVQTLTITSIHSHLKFDKIALVPVGTSPITQNSTAGTPVVSDSTEFTEYQAQSTYTDQNYLAWLENQENNEYRMAAVELDHDSGTVFLASHPFMTNRGLPYHNNLIGSPSVSQSLGEAVTVGTINAVNPKGNEWSRLNFAGHQARLLYGDKRWNINQFRRVATCDLETDPKLVSEGVYTYDLASSFERFDRVFYSGEDLPINGTVVQALDLLFKQHPQAMGYGFINCQDEHLDRLVSFTITESSKLSSLMRVIGNSIGASVRIAQFGQVEFVRPDSSSFINLDGKNIVRGSVKSASVENAYRYFEVTYNDGNDSVTYDSRVESGAYATTKTLETYCVTLADANTVIGELAAKHTNKIHNYSIQILNATTLFNSGDYVRIDSDSLQGLGIIENMDRSLLFSNSEIEVAMV